MKFCYSLVSEINFEPGSIQPCCNIHDINTPAFPFDAHAFKLKDYIAYIERVVRELQSGSDLCEGCAKLRNVENTGAEKFQVLFRTVSLNAHRFFCNCKCTYCSLWQHNHKGYGYDPLPAIQQLHSSKILHKNCYFSWGGGEPSILPFFENANLWISSKGYFQNIHTNALKFSSAIAKMLNSAAGKINISLDSASQKTYRNVKGVDAFEKVKENIKRYVASSQSSSQVELKYIIFNKNNEISEIKHFLDLGKSLGIQNLQVSLDFREINTDTVDKKTLIACAFLLSQSEKEGFICQPFSIPQRIKNEIDSLRDKFFR